MEEENYIRIEYDKYQCDHPDESLYNEVRGNRTLFNTIGIEVCERTYNIKITNTMNSNLKKYRIYISFTKHICCSISAEFINNKITRMYFSDITVIKEDNDYIIKEIKSYKINIGNVPNLRYIAENSSTYGIKFGTLISMPYKIPLIGLSNKKLFLPQRSSFIEGLHVNIYKQNYIFNWLYTDTYQDPTDVNSYEYYYDYNISENLKSNPSDGFQYTP